MSLDESCLNPAPSLARQVLSAPDIILRCIARAAHVRELCGAWALRAGWAHAQVHHALDVAYGGNPGASLDEVVAKLARARVHAHLHLLFCAERF